MFSTCTPACQLELYLLPQCEVHYAMPAASPCSVSYLPYKETEPLSIPILACSSYVTSGGRCRCLCWPTLSPAAVMGTASLPAEQFDLSGCTSVKLPVYGAADQFAGAGGKPEQIASVGLTLQVSSVASSVLKGPSSALERPLSAVQSAASYCRVPQVTGRSASAGRPVSVHTAAQGNTHTVKAAGVSRYVGQHSAGQIPCCAPS